MFRQHAHYRQRVPQESAEVQKLRQERDYLKQELFRLKNQSHEPEKISAVEVAGMLVDNKTPLHIVLNPYIPFNVVKLILGYAWMSGCFGGLSMVFASGLLGFQLLSLVFIMLMILCTMIVAFIYLDA